MSFTRDAIQPGVPLEGTHIVNCSAKHASLSISLAPCPGSSHLVASALASGFGRLQREANPPRNYCLPLRHPFGGSPEGRRGS